MSDVKTEPTPEEARLEKKRQEERAEKGAAKTGTKRTKTQNFKLTDKETPLVEVEKTFRATPAQLFNAWSNAEMIQQWWGPKDFDSPSAELNFEVGGKYLFVMRNTKKKDQKIWSAGQFMVIEDDHKIVCSMYPANEKGERSTSEDGPFADEGDAYVTVEITPVNTDQTKMKLTHAGLPARMHDECVEGWSESLEKLREVVEHH